MTIQDKLRFWDSIERTDSCWIWTGTYFRQGYGAFHADGKLRRAHRVAYELMRRVTLTPDQFLHHTCRNKGCVRPDHMEITNQWDHVDSATYGNKDKTHCPHGHEYTPENIWWNKNGKSRECRTCKYAHNLRYHQRRREARAQEAAARASEFAEGRRRYFQKRGWELPSDR